MTRRLVGVFPSVSRRTENIQKVALALRLAVGDLRARKGTMNATGSLQFASVLAFARLIYAKGGMSMP